MILKLYTQFPRCYPGGIAEMMVQLDDIAAMGFNAVWINPLHLSGLKKVVRHREEVSGSLYAMRSCDLFNPKFFGGKENNDVQAIEQHENYRNLLVEYTKKAVSLGIAPVFDLVLGQVAAELDPGAVDPAQNPLVDQFRGVLVDNITERDDIRKFRYNRDTDENSQAIQEKIFTELWQPFIHKYINKYGFQGVRIDAVKWVPPYLLQRVCAYIKEICPEAIILGELLDNSPLHYVDQLRGQGLTHVNNSVAHMPFTVEARSKDKQEGGWNAGNYTLSEIAELRQIGLPSHGGSVGYSGNHDELSLSLRVLKDNRLERNPPAPDEFMRLAREKLFGIVLSSDAGWYALAGDEFLIDRRSYMVFDNYNPPDFISGDHPMDLRGFITSINTLLSHLPTPEAFWVEHILSEESDLKHYSIAIRHTQEYNDERDVISLVCASMNGKAADDPEALFGSLGKILREHLAKTKNNVTPKTLFILDDQYLLEKNIETKEITAHRQPIKRVAAANRM